MSTLARTDMSLLGQWWWTVDRWSLGALLALIMFGVLMIFAASPAVAVRLNLDSFHFVQRHFIVVPVIDEELDERINSSPSKIILTILGPKGISEGTGMNKLKFPLESTSRPVNSCSFM